MENIPEHRIDDPEIALGGDSVERTLWPYLKDQLPNYEVFWSEFVWPITNRVHGSRAGLKVNTFRQEVRKKSPDLIRVAQSQYTAFRHMGSAYLRVHRWPFESVEEADPHRDIKYLLHHDRLADVYRLLLSVDDILAATAAALERLDRAEPVPEPLDGEALEALRATVRVDFEGWIKKPRFAKAWAEHQRTGATYSFPALHGRVSLRRLLPDDLLSVYDPLRARLSKYRNLLHKAQPSQMWRGGKHLVPKPEALDKYELWPDMAVASPEEEARDFQSLEDALQRDFKDFTGVLNRAWEVFIHLMRRLATKPQYREWTGTEPRADLAGSGPPGLSHVYISTLIAPATTSTMPLPPSGFKADDLDSR